MGYFRWSNGTGVSICGFATGEVIYLCEECAERYYQGDFWEAGDENETCEICGK